MLVIVKKPYTEISLNGEGADKLFTLISNNYEVEVLSVSDEESVPLQNTDFWRNRKMLPNRAGRMLRASRQLVKMTQLEMAKNIGAKQNVISEYENGKRKITDRVARKFAKTLNVSMELFV